MSLNTNLELAYVPVILATISELYKNNQEQAQLLITALSAFLARLSHQTDTQAPRLAETCCRLADGLDQIGSREQFGEQPKGGCHYGDH